MSDKEQKELDLIAHVFEKFLYGKLLEREGVRAEGLKVVWLDENPQEATSGN